MNTAFLSFALLCVVSTISYGFETEVDSNGESQSAFEPAESMTLSLTNGYEHDINFYYVNADTDSEHYMATILPGEHYTMNSFTGHSFVVKKESDETLLSTFIVVKGVSDLLLGPVNRPLVSPGNGVKQNRRHPNIIDIPGHRTTATAVIFRSLSTRHMQIWYDNGSPTGSYSGEFLPGGQSTTNAYFGHKFFFTDKQNSSHRVATIEINRDKVLYVIRDDEDHQVSSDLILKTENEEQFMKEYLEKNGIHWRHHYGKDGPRPPPILYMWPTTTLGETHKVETSSGYWTCLEKSCQTSKTIPLELEVVSQSPKVFYVKNFLNNFEADHIISVAKNSISVSMVGDGAAGFASDTRTSKNAWIKRSKNALIDNLYRRAADVFNVDEAILTMDRNAEEIQVVHYENNQRYEPHHDWGASMNHPNSRIFTMLMYLTDQEDPPNGGETSFPKAGTGAGFKVKPVKGDAVLFYNLLEDGNGDDLALHAALPVTHGEKWLANFWVWDAVKSVRD